MFSEVDAVVQQSAKAVLDRLGSRCVLAIALVAALGVALAFATAPFASAVDLGEKNCSITVSMPASSDVPESQEADVVYDLYQVAFAEETPGYDAYTFRPVPALEGTSFDWSTLGSSESYDTLAQLAAQKTPLNDQAAADALLPLAASAEDAGQAAENLEAGLYLIIAHGTGLTPDQYTVRQSDGALSSLAFSPHYEFTFKPELVAVPSKVGAAGEFTTAGSGPWIYDMSVTLKPGHDQRFGSLQIIKDLPFYDAGKPADFVFRIDAYSDEAHTDLVYSNVVRMQFTAAEQQTYKLEGVIPAGSYVVVTEVYSGSSYKVEGQATQEAGPIVADPIPGTDPDQAPVVSVAFVNSYNDVSNPGGSIVNSFTYATPQDKASQGKTDLQWLWSKE